MITSRSVYKNGVESLDTAALTFVAPISNALAGFLIPFATSFLPASAQLLPKFSITLPIHSTFIALSLTIFGFFFQIF